MDNKHVYNQVSKPSCSGKTNNENLISIKSDCMVINIVEVS